MLPFLVAGIAAVVGLLGSSVHFVKEGNDAVCYRNGALLNETFGPGPHLKNPLFDKCEEVRYTVQTDSVDDVPCGTASGVLIYFKKIEVVNRLDRNWLLPTVQNYTANYDQTWIYDKIHHEMNQFCSRNTLQQVYIEKFDTIDDYLVQQLRQDLSKWAPGIEIIAVRVTKPIVSRDILNKFEEIEKEAINLQIASNRRKVEKEQAEAREEHAIILARQEASVAEIKNNQTISSKETEYRAQEIENKGKRSIADTKLYEDQQVAKGNDVKLTDNFLKNEQIKALSSIKKIYFGQNIPNVLVESNENSDANPAASAVVSTVVKENAAENVCVGSACNK